MGLHVIPTPLRTPVANAICERVIGTMRRECLDFLIPLGEDHLHSMVKEWVEHDNEGRPHKSLGSGIPKSPPGLLLPLQTLRHWAPEQQYVVARPILGGLHHDYRIEKKIHNTEYF
jgi:transposase InsO family protein